jgi:hypothetical protein
MKARRSYLPPRVGRHCMHVAARRRCAGLRLAVVLTGLVPTMTQQLERSHAIFVAAHQLAVIKQDRVRCLRLREGGAASGGKGIKTASLLGRRCKRSCRGLGDRSRRSSSRTSRPSLSDAAVSTRSELVVHVFGIAIPGHGTPQRLRKVWIRQVSFAERRAAPQKKPVGRVVAGFLRSAFGLGEQSRYAI